MAKINLKGVITKVSPVETVGVNGTKKQSIILFIPGYVDQFGDKKGQDEEWQLDAIGTVVEKLKMSEATHIDQKAECTVFLSSRGWTNEEGKRAYFIGANVNEITLLGVSNSQATKTELPTT